MWQDFRSFLSDYSRCLILILTPIVLLPLPLISSTPAINCAYVVLMMTVFWVTNSLNLAVVSLFPMALFPVFGIMDTNAVCMTYMRDNNAVYLACLSVGIALEHSGCHKRMALLLLLKIGTSPRMLLIGVMTATTVISMWIMNTVAAAMMIPIVDAVFDSLVQLERRRSEAVVPLKQLSSGEKSYEEYFGSYHVDEYNEDIEEQSKSSIMRYKKCILLSVAYAANIGGIATLTGTSPNIVFSQIFTMMYGPNTGMSYATWLLFGFPATVVCTMFTCALLQFIFVETESDEKSNEQALAAKIALEKECEKLGPITFHEVGVMMSFTALVLLYFFRRPHFMPGWESAIDSSKIITDAVPAITIVILMCALPARPSEVFKRKQYGRVSTLLDWESIQNKLPWDLILLTGCGYAIAAGFQESGLNDLIGSGFAILENFPPGLLCFMAALLSSFITEVASNASTASILLPLVGKMAERLHVNPLYFMLPVAISCSFSFMLPIATGPNAMVFKASNMRTKDMLYVGFLTNCACVVILYFLLNSLGVQVYNLNVFPDWADSIPITLVKNTTVFAEFVSNGTLLI